MYSITAALSSPRFAMSFLTRSCARVGRAPELGRFVLLRFRAMFTIVAGIFIVYIHTAETEEETEEEAEAEAEEEDSVTDFLLLLLLLLLLFGINLAGTTAYVSVEPNSRSIFLSAEVAPSYSCFFL